MSTHVYSADQVARYLAYIRLDRRPEVNLDFLTDLISHHYGRVPFECLDLHYTPARQLSLDPEDLYCKVLDRQRGGYCMELNTFFGAVLRALGFTVTSAGGRVNLPSGVYGGITHMVNLVTLDGTKHLVDVGHGVYGPAVPLPLVDDVEHPVWGGRHHMRLQYRALPAHTDRCQRVWVYGHTLDPVRAGPDGWFDAYAFTEDELFPTDYVGLNMWPMSAPDSPFVRSVVVQRHVRDPATGTLAGLVTLINGRLRMRLDDKGTDVTTILPDEDARAAALVEHFNVRLTDDERAAIRGRPSALGQDVATEHK